jgi:alpha-L-rhamnosidase
LTWAEASLETNYGLLKSRWDKKGDQLILKITLPANTSALLRLPTKGKTAPTIKESGKVVLNGGKSGEEIDGIKFVSLEKDAAVFEIGSGNYEFVVL